MRIEIPTFTRCCGCLPLRRGIIVLGYLSLAISILLIFVEIQIYEGWNVPSMVLFRGAGFTVAAWLPILLYCVEIIFIIILLVGAHMEKPRLIRMYYYYGITTTVAAFVIGIMSLSTREIHFDDHYISFFNYLVDLATVILGIVTEVYLLLLIRSELQKPQETLRYDNHLAEVCIQPPVRESDLSFL